MTCRLLLHCSSQINSTESVSLVDPPLLYQVEVTVSVYRKGRGYGKSSAAPVNLPTSGKFCLRLPV